MYAYVYTESSHSLCSDNKTSQTRFTQVLEQRQSSETQEHATLSLQHTQCSMPGMEEVMPQILIEVGMDEETPLISLEEGMEGETPLISIEDGMEEETPLISLEDEMEEATPLISIEDEMEEATPLISIEDEMEEATPLISIEDRMEEAISLTAIETSTHSKAKSSRPSRKVRAQSNERSDEKVKQPKNTKQDKGTRRRSHSMDADSPSVSRHTKNKKRIEGDKKPKRRRQPSEDK